METELIVESSLFALSLTVIVYAFAFLCDWSIARLMVWYCSRKKIIIDEEYHPASNDWTVAVFDRSGPGSKYKTHEVIINTGCSGVYFLTKSDARSHGVKEALNHLKTKR